MKYFFFIIIFSQSIFSDDKLKTDDVIWPMKLKLPISGTFAEYRNSHLHMGCDFKTYGINGYPILSVFDGHISSISYSDKGYGLSVNIYSPKLNLTAKYAHLNDFVSDVKDLENLKLALLLLNDNSFSVKLPKDKFNLKKGQNIARSGETGSGVSHLHLELFDSKEYYNPLIFKDYKQKDNNPPTLLSLFLESDSGYFKKINLISTELSNFEFKEKEEFELSGKLKLKIAAFDRISSKNQNNIFSYSLYINQKLVFEKKFEKMSFSESREKEDIYDSNKSSLSPAYYVYNLFSKKESYSLDLDEFKTGEKISVKIELKDASSNSSFLNFNIKKMETSKKANSSISKKFISDDSNLSLDFSKSKITGEGSVQIEKVSLPENIIHPNLKPVGDAYHISASDYSWKGEVFGEFKSKLNSKNQSLYIYDSVLNRWSPLSVQSKSPIRFQFSRLGIISILEDNSPPEIYYPYLIYRYYNLPEISNPNLIERFYAVSDRGSGVSSNFEVFLDGEKYPYQFDRDRNFIKLEIPKKLKPELGYILISIRAHDYAGNYSEWFTDIYKN